MNLDLTGTLFAGRYRLISVLGQGGMGTVYKALDVTFNRFVAIKTLRSLPREGVQQLAAHEGAAARLRHPNILRILDVGEASGCAYVAMDFIEGRSLAEILREGKPLETHVAIALVADVAAALSFAHQSGVIHRDVKPTNILVSNSGQVLLTDFGLAAKVGAGTLTPWGTVLGTPAYMSPEQAMGLPLDGRSDVYSLAVVLYEALSGHLWTPRIVSPAELLKQVVEVPLPSVRERNPHVPVAVERVLQRALAKNADARYASADEFAQALRRASIGQSSASQIKVPTLAAPESSAAPEAIGRMPATLTFFPPLLLVVIAVSLAVGIGMMIARRAEGPLPWLVGSALVILLAIAWRQLRRNPTVELSPHRPSIEERSSQSILSSPPGGASPITIPGRNQRGRLDQEMLDRAPASSPISSIGSAPRLPDDTTEAKAYVEEGGQAETSETAAYGARLDAPTGTVQVYLPAEPLTTFSLRDTTAGNSGADLQRRMKAFSSIWDELTQAAALDD